MPARIFVSITLFAALVWSACAGAAQTPAPFVANIPFQPCDGMICFKAGIDGGPQRTLALDTGDVISDMLSGPAGTLGWHPKPIVRNGKTLPGIEDGGHHVLTVGNARIEVHFAVVEPVIFGPHRLPVDGTLAYTALKDRIVRIDYPHHMLSISAPVTDPVSASNAPGTLKLITFGHHGPPIVVGAPFTINGQPVHAQIDTMYTGSMVVYDAALARLGLHKQGNPTLFDFTDGGVEMLKSTARSLGFGDLRLLGKHPTVYFAGHGSNPVHQPDGLFEATVGNALFAHSVVTMNFHAMTLDVQPAH
jgi:hypothetical protein